jgi:hypothetical protein
VFSSWHLGGNGKVAEGAVKWGVLVVESDGDPTPRFWRAASKLSDHRITPQQTVTEAFTVPIPADAAGPMCLVARLRHGAASPCVLPLGWGEDNEAKLPTVEMAATKGTLRAGE